MCIARILFLCLSLLISKDRHCFEGSNKPIKMVANDSFVDGFQSLIESLSSWNGLLFLFTFLVLVCSLVSLTTLTVKLSAKVKDLQERSLPDRRRQERRDTDRPTPRVRFRGTHESYEDESYNAEADSFAPVRPSAPQPSTSTPLYTNHRQPPASPALSPLNFLQGESPLPRPAATSQRQPNPSPYDQEDYTYPPDSSFFGRRKERVPESFNGANVELKDWLFTFNVLARLNGWTEAEKGSQLTSLLRGNAQQVLEDLPAEYREDYQTVVETLKRRFDPEEKKGLKKMEFKNRTKRKNESVTEYGYALSRMTKGAYPNLDYEAREELATEQFIDGLSGLDIQRHVQFGRPTSLNQAIALATEFETFESRREGRKPEVKPVRAMDKKDNKRDNKRDRESEVAKAAKELTKEIVHQLKAQPQQRSPHQTPPQQPHQPLLQTPRQIPRCQGCNGLGHEVWACPHQYPPPAPAQAYQHPAPAQAYQHGGYTNSTRPGPANRGCHHCGDLSHWIRDCPQRRRGANHRNYQAGPQVNNPQAHTPGPSSPVQEN